MTYAFCNSWNDESKRRPLAVAVTTPLAHVTSTAMCNCVWKASAATASWVARVKAFEDARISTVIKVELVLHCVHGHAKKDVKDSASLGEKLDKTK